MPNKTDLMKALTDERDVVSRIRRRQQNQPMRKITFTVPVTCTMDGAMDLDEQYRFRYPITIKAGARVEMTLLPDEGVVEITVDEADAIRINLTHT